MNSRQTGKQALELVGMLMIGDGVLGVVQMERHLNLWKGWSQWLDRTTDYLLERAALTRALSLLEVGAGLALTSVLTGGVSQVPQRPRIPSPASSIEEAAAELIQI